MSANPHNVLITGGAGFIGSHCCERFLAQGRSVVAIDDLSTGSIENIRALRRNPNFQFVRESIFNALVMDRLCSQADMVVHLAAAVGVKLIVENPVHTINTNVRGTEIVLTTANRYGCKVLLASTSEVYGKGIKAPFEEDDDCLIGATSHSRWAYAASKTVDEFLALAYHAQFGLPVVIMRFFNTIGPRQTGQYGMVVPRLVRRALRNEPLEVHGDGEQTRCFVDVEDTLDAIAGLSQAAEAIGQVFNVGSQEEISVNALAQKIIQLTGSRSEIHHIPSDQAYAPGFEDLRRRAPSIEKINRLIGYRPKYTLEQSLLRVIEFERKALP